RALAEKEHRLAARELRLHEKDIELRESALTKNERFVSENRKMLENLVRSLREGELTREKTKEVKRFIEGLEQGLDAERENTQEVKNALDDARKRHGSTGQNAAQNGAAANAFAVGSDVFAGPSKIRGTIVGKAKKGGWIVQTGSMKINCKEADLAPAPSPIKSARTAPAAPSFSVEMEGTSGAASAQADRAVYELRLLGMHLEDALKALERQIDLCTLQGLHEFSVIHGKGDGILQEGVHRLLSSYGCVQDFYFAPPEDGGTGKTYVRLG
ncbi:MAG: Smr/MutS family protein, partial [Treponema maltophilum]